MDKQDILLITKLQQLKGIQPNNEWRVLFRDKLKAEMGISKVLVETTVKSNADKKFMLGIDFSKFIQIIPKLHIVPKMSFASAAIMSLFIVYGGIAVTYTAANSLPGDSLYPVKLAAEKARFALASDEEKRVVLRFEFINNRLNEMDAAVNLNEPENVKTDKVTVAVNAIKKEMNDINTDFDKYDKKVGSVEPVRTVKMAKNIDDSISSYSKTLAAAVVKFPEAVKEKTKHNVSETIKIAEETSNKTLLVLIERNNVAPIVTNEELVERVEQKIADTEAKLKDIKERAQTLANAEENIMNSALSDKMSIETNEANSKIPGNDKTSNVLSNEAQEMLVEARAKLETNDLSGALKNATASESIVKATESIIDASAIVVTGIDNTIAPSITPLPDEIVNNGSEENKDASSIIINPIIPLKTVAPSPTLSITPTVTPNLQK